MDNVVKISDVKRGQILEAKAKAEDKSLRPRPRPRTSLRGRGRGRGQNHEAEAEDNFLSPLITYKKSSLATMSHHFNLSSLLSS